MKKPPCRWWGSCRGRREKEAGVRPALAFKWFLSSVNHVQSVVHILLDAFTLAFSEPAFYFVPHLHSNWVHAGHAWPRASCNPLSFHSSNTYNTYRYAQ